MRSKTPGSAASWTARISEIVQQVKEAGGVPAPAAPALHMVIELIDQRRHRQQRAVAVGLGQADAEVLPHPVHGEAEVELAVQHGVTAVFHLPALRGTLGY